MIYNMIYKKFKLFVLRLISILLLIVLAIAASLKYYEMTYFKPHIPYIKERYNQARKRESLNERVKEIIFCLETPFYHKKNPYRHFAGVVAIHFVSKFVKYQKISEWHFYNWLWTQLLIYHFGEEKLFLLFLHQIPFEQGFGLANSAQYYFQKTISQLTVEEVVMLLGIARSPITRLPFKHPEKAKEIQGLLMEKLIQLNCLPE